MLYRGASTLLLTMMVYHCFPNSAQTNGRLSQPLHIAFFFQEHAGASFITLQFGSDFSG